MPSAFYVAPKSFSTREEWLNAFAEAAKPYFANIAAPIPDKVRMSCGFTSMGARGKRIGECWTSECSGDESFEIFISPKIADASKVAGILTHELIHAAVGIKEGHKGAFKRVALSLGLEGKMTATTEGEAWHKWADPILTELGPIPHATLTATGGKKQTTRLLKVECPACGFVMRVTKKWVEGKALQCPDMDCGECLTTGEDGEDD